MLLPVLAQLATGCSNPLLSLSDLLLPFAVVLDEEEASLDLSLELLDLLLAPLSALDSPMVVDQVVGGG